MSTAWCGETRESMTMANPVSMCSGCKGQETRSGQSHVLTILFVLCRVPHWDYKGNGYKLWVQWFLKSFGWTKVSYDWSMVFKETINQSERTRVHQTIPKPVAPKACIHSPGLAVSVLTWGGKKICLVWGTKKLLVVHTITRGTEISSCSKGRKRM